MFEENINQLPCVSLRLSSGRNEKERVPMSSGLNWGQRPGRDQNQGYIAIPADVQKSNFFPTIGVEFNVVTDDGEAWKCARRQANGKALHTVDDNAIIGRYFRKRLGLSSGDLVTLADLLKYGRTTIDFYKSSNELYLLDFGIR